MTPWRSRSESRHSIPPVETALAIKGYRDALTHVLQLAAARDLQSLAGIGLLIPQGEKRGRYYTAGADLAALRGAIVDKRNPRDYSDPFGESSDR